MSEHHIVTPAQAAEEQFKECVETVNRRLCRGERQLPEVEIGEGRVERIVALLRASGWYARQCIGERIRYVEVTDDRKEGEAWAARLDATAGPDK